MGNENLITDKTYRQIIAIRDSGACNMFDLLKVQEEAYKMGFYELVVFLNETRSIIFITNRELSAWIDAVEDKHLCQTL